MSVLRVIYTTSNALTATYKIMIVTLAMYYLVKETKIRIQDEKNKD